MRSFYKIMHTASGTRWGDIENRIFHELVWMARQGHTLILVCPKDTPLFLKAKEYGLKVYGLDFKPFSMTKNYTFLKNFLYNEKPDILHTHGRRDSGLALYAAGKLMIPLRIVFHHDNGPLKKNPWNRMIYKRLCHYIFTSSRHTTGHLQKMFGLKDMRAFTMPAGIVEPSDLMDRNDARKALAQELNLDLKTKFIGVSGTLSQKKEISTLLESFEKLRSSIPGYHLVITGHKPDPSVNKLTILAAGMNIQECIHFMDKKEDPWPHLRAIDCHILPCLDPSDEDMAFKRRMVLCAMLCETPVIGPDSTVITDIIKHEETGLVYDESSGSDLSDKLFSTLQNENSTRMRSEAARDFVKKQHTMDVLGRDIIRIYSLHQIRMKRPSYQD